MFNIPLFENEKIVAWTDESQRTIAIQNKTTKEFLRLVQGDEVSTFRRYSAVAGLIEQIRQRTAAEKEALAAKEQHEINTVISESELYFNGFAV